jgi:hypothetical protein
VTGPRTPDQAGTTESPRRAQLLSALAEEIRAVQAAHRRDVETLRAELDRLGGLLGEHTDLLAEQLPRWVDLTAQVEALTAARGARRGEPEAGARPVDWYSLSADDAAAEWDALGGWLARVGGPVYGFTRGQIPDCWPLHTPAVVELVWLRRCHAAAHRADAPPTAAAEWHVRWRREALAAVAAAIPALWCRPGEHYVSDQESRDRRERAARANPRPPEPLPRHVPGTPPPELEHAPELHVTTPQCWDKAYQTAVRNDLAQRRARQQPTAGASGSSGPADPR